MVEAVVATWVEKSIESVENPGNQADPLDRPRHHPSPTGTHPVCISSPKPAPTKAVFKPLPNEVQAAVAGFGKNLRGGNFHTSSA